MSLFESVKEKYVKLGVNVEDVLEQLKNIGFFVLFSFINNKIC